MVPELNSQQKL